MKDTWWSQPHQPVLCTSMSQGHGCGLQRPGLEETSNHTRKSRTLAVPLPPNSQGIQKVHSSLRWRPWQCTGESPSWALGHQPCGLKKHGSGDQRPKFESQICYLAALWRCTSYLLLLALASSSEKWRQNCLPLKMAVKIRDGVYQVPSQHLYEKGAQ